MLPSFSIRRIEARTCVASSSTVIPAAPAYSWIHDSEARQRPERQKMLVRGEIVITRAFLACTISQTPRGGGPGGAVPAASERPAFRDQS